MAKVMMVGTSQSSGGGISSVIRLIKKMSIWGKYSCYWLGTQTQRGIIVKLCIAIKAAVIAPAIMWRYDIIHFHMVPGITLLIQLPQLLTAKLFRKKIILEVHIGNQLEPYASNKFFKWWLRQADIILLLARKWKELFKELYADVNKPTDVLYNACEMIPVISPEEKGHHIIFAGTIHDNKAPDILLKAWSKLSLNYPDWTVTFMGSGDIAKYEQMATNLGISHCVKFTGYIKGDEKERQFHDASIYCMCSYVEGFPMVVLEAWTHSIAVITTPVGGLPDAIEEGENCLTFPFGDSDSLADRLKLLIDDVSLRNKISAAGYRYAQEHFSLEKVSQKLDSIYSRLLLQ